MTTNELALELHEKWNGKIDTVAKCTINSSKKVLNCTINTLKKVLNCTIN